MDSSPVSVTSKFCGAENTGDESCGGSRVAAVQGLGRGSQSVHALSVDSDNTILIFDIDSHAAETADGGEAVSALQKVMDLCSSLRNGSERMTLRWEMDLSPRTVISPRTWSALCNFHINSLVICV